MARSASSSEPFGTAQLVDENEQLRASLESALEENALLIEERDRLRHRMREISREVRVLDGTALRQQERVDVLEPAIIRQGETEEALRTAFEELQVLTEELEVANTSLQQTNSDLDARVELRTRQLSDLNDVQRATESWLRAIADLVPELLWRADARGQADWFNQRWQTFTGRTAQDLLGMGWFDVIHPRDHDVARTTWSIAIASGKPFEHQHRIRDEAGNYRWFLVRAEPLRDEDGRVIRWFAAGTDIDDQRAALETLQRAELRFRTLVEGMPQLVWRSYDGGRWTWSSPQWSAYTGQTEDEAGGLGWLDAYHPDDRRAARDAWKQAKSTGVLEIEGRILHAAENRYRHFRTRALPVRDARDRVLEWLGTSTDVDDILELQEQQALLVAELQHRTRNLMGIVQSVTARTVHGSSSLAQFKERIDDRLSAIARVQGLLSRREGGLRVPFDVLLDEELSAHGQVGSRDGEGKVTVDGPSGISLRSGIVQTFALALHELMTNAVKYGALADPNGRLHIAWSVQPGANGERMLTVDWRETGVADMPDASAPPRGGGYGRELIERALPYQLGARTTYAMNRDGVHCIIEVAVPPDDGATEKNGG